MGFLEQIDKKRPQLKNNQQVSGIDTASLYKLKISDKKETPSRTPGGLVSLGSSNYKGIGAFTSLGSNAIRRLNGTDTTEVENRWDSAAQSTADALEKGAQFNLSLIDELKKDKSIKSKVGDLAVGALGVISGGGEFVASPIMGALIGPKGVSEDGFLSKLGNAFTYIGKKTTQGVDFAVREFNNPGQLVDPTPSLLSDFQRSGLEEYSIDAALAAGFPVAGSLAKSTIKGTKNLATNAIIKFDSASKALKRAESIIAENKKTVVSQALGFDESLFKKELLKIETKLQNGNSTKVEVNDFLNRYNIKGTNKKHYLDSLSEQKSIRKQKAKAQLESSNTLIEGMRTRTFSKIDARAKKLGYTPVAKSNKEILEKLRTEFNQKDVDAFNNWQLKNSDEGLISEMKLIQDGKRDVVGAEKSSVVDTGDDVYKAQITLSMEDRGLVIKNSDGGYSYTPKGVEALKRSNPGISTKALDELQKKGAFHVPEESINIAKARRDGDIFTDSEALDLYNDLRGSKELVELKRLLLEKELGKTYPQLDGDILAVANKASRKYNLGIDSNEFLDSLTGKINSAKLDDFIKALIETRDKGFLQYKNIKTIDKSKTLSGQLGFQQRLFNEIYKQGEKMAEAIYNKSIKDISKKYDAKIDAIKVKYKDDINSLEVELKIARRAKREELAKLSASSRDTYKLKRMIESNLNDWISEGKFSKGVIRRMKEKIRSGGLWDRLDINDTKGLDKFFYEMNKTLVETQADNLRYLITEEFKNLKKGNRKSATKSKRLKIDAYTKNKLLELKSVYESGEFNIQDLTEILEDLRSVQTKSNQYMKSYTLRRNVELDKKLKQIEIEGINPQEGVKDINSKAGSRDSGIKKIKLISKSFNLMTRYTSRTWEKIFGGIDTIGYKAIYEGYIQAEDLANKFKEQFLNESLLTMEKLLGGYKGGEDFLIYMQSIQKVDTPTGVSFFGLENIRNAPSHSNYFEKIGDAIKWTDDMLLPEREWKTIDGTRLQKMLKEKANSPEFQASRRLIKSLNDKLFPALVSAVERNEGIVLKRRGDYISMGTRSGDTNVKMDVDGNNFLNSKMSDGFINEIRIHGNKSKVDYDTNIFDLLPREVNKQVSYIFMKDLFEDTKRLLNGKTFNIRAIDDITDYIEAGYKLFNKKGDEVFYTEYVDGKLYSGTTELDFDGFEFRVPNSGIKHKLGKSGEKFANAWLSDLANGGLRQSSDAAKILGGGVQLVSKQLISFNISPMAKQYLVLIDALATMPVGDLISAQFDIITNKQLRKRLDKVPAIIARGSKGGHPAMSDAVGTVSKLGGIKKYDNFLNMGLDGLKILDKKTYRVIWYSAYRRELKNAGIEFDGYFSLDDSAVKATDKTNRIASTAQPMALPPALKDPVSKMFFSIMSTQLNRIQQAGDGFIKIRKGISKGDMAEARDGLRIASFYLAGNVADAYISYQLSKILFELGLSTWDGYEDSFLDEIFNVETMWRLTFGSTISGGMGLSMAQGFDAFPALGYVNNIQDAVQAAYKQDGETFIKELGNLVGGKLAKYLIAASE